ncbi:class I SAM-dependent methyltransferase [Vulgatibacter sp.]|uniref:class I SAM-dependent methyltransferase n=1 Tax=Vulgatibacter sp. TaxID=1971226 RepID=UPI0035691E5D
MVAVPNELAGQQARDVDAFLNPRATPSTLDNFLVRRALLGAIDRHLPLLHGTLLDVGCGQMPYRKRILAAGRVERYVGLDLPASGYGEPDLTWDGETIPLGDASVDAVLATELLEHCPRPHAVLAEIHRVLRPGGALLFTVPFLWPLHCVPHDEHRFTPFALRRLLGEAGFGGERIEALGGWDAALAQLLGLWVRRRPMPRPLRGLLSIAAWPVVAGLGALDRPPAAFRESTMLLGLCGTARKQPPGDVVEGGGDDARGGRA